MPVKFYLHAETNKKGEHPIRISVSIGYTRLMTGIGFSCSEESWSNGTVRPRYVNSKGIPAKIINDRIAKISAHFTNYEISLTGTPTQQDLKHQLQLAINNELQPAAQPKKTKTLFNHFDDFISTESVASQWAYATLQCWKTFRHHLEAFNPRMTFQDFDEDGINRFLHFLRAKQELGEITVKKQYNCLKWFLGWALKKGLCTDHTITTYRPKFKVLEKPVIFLTKEELLKLYNYQIPDNGTEVSFTDMNGTPYTKTVQDAGALAKTRDLFCFCAFTSLRYSDMAKVKRTDIKGDTLYITTQKTNDRLPIDLNSFAKAILDKYKDEKFIDGLALPVISNQKMNEYLKDLCEFCGFNEPISRTLYRGGQRIEETYPKWAMVGTHAGRRTFICFALASGIPPQVIMKWTGHADYKTMKPYIDIAEKTKAAAMNLFDENLKK